MIFRLLSDWLASRSEGSGKTSESDDIVSTKKSFIYAREGFNRIAEGKTEEAERAFRKAVSVSDNKPETQFYIGDHLARAGAYEQAARYLNSALEKDPHFHKARKILANVYISQNHYDLAARLLLEMAHDDAEPAVLSNYGLTLYRQKKYSQAIHWLKKALSKNPQSIEAHNNLGLAYQAEGQTEDAEKSFSRALAINATHPEALKNLCRIMIRRGQYINAIDVATKALNIAPSLQEARVMVGYALFESGDFENAANHLRLASQAGEDDVTLSYLARALQCMGLYNEAFEYFGRSLLINPNSVETRWYRSLALLQREDFAQGWSDYEFRLKSEEPPPRKFSLPRWNGETSKKGHVLIYAEQGIGDQLMFSSCIPDALKQVERCTIECSTTLQSLFRLSFPTANVVGTDYAHPADWLHRVNQPDLAIPIGSLPMHFRKKHADFPSHRGYLTADQKKIEHWRRTLSELGPGPKIGISWTGGTEKSRRNLRSVPLTMWHPILTAPGAQFVNLQYTPCANELLEAEKSLGTQIHHWQHSIDDYDETAALVSALDLVISVQTAIIHLCGALGRPAWVLVPASAEWRYGHQGESMHWYPSVRLFRQKTLGDWPPVVDRIANELSIFSQQHADGRA